MRAPGPATFEETGPVGGVSGLLAASKAALCSVLSVAVHVLRSASAAWSRFLRSLRPAGRHSEYRQAQAQAQTEGSGSVNVQGISWVQGTGAWLWTHEGVRSAELVQLVLLQGCPRPRQQG
jgi:hypothetical protein